MVVCFFGVSIGFESRCAETSDGILGKRSRRRVGLLQVVEDAQLFPFKAPQLMEGQNVDAFDVA